jgi:hypothetical protein
LPPYQRSQNEVIKNTLTFSAKCNALIKTPQNRGFQTNNLFAGNVFGVNGPKTSFVGKSISSLVVLFSLPSKFIL